MEEYAEMGTERLERLLQDVATVPKDRATEDRYRGALLGLAAGNALGLPVEGQTRAAIQRRFPSGLTEVFPEEANRPWDDDLAQAIILTDVLCESNEIDLDDLAQRLLRWGHENGRGMGQLTRQVFNELESGAPAAEAARRAWEVSGWSTAGNGAVMRCAPVALRWRASPKTLIAAARSSALVTHYDARCEWSTVVVVAIIAGCLSDRPPDPEALAIAIDAVGEKGWAAEALQQVSEAIRQPNGKDLVALELDDPMDMGYTLKTMQVALWCLRQPKNFESVLTEVVGAGGDTDTNGAVAGAVMGSRTGASGIPSRWLANIADIDRVADIASRLYRLS
jgi:ADP-ribosyl-[dinitrogen reductase] hydrolase